VTDIIDNRNGAHIKAHADIEWEESLPPQTVTLRESTLAAVIEQHAQEIERIVAWIGEFASGEQDRELLQRAARNLYRMGRLHQIIEGGV
jgi:hypothetical protein